MILSTWTTELAQRGITVLPPTTIVPVDMYASLPDGCGLHFRCRGTRVTLSVFAAADVQLAVPVREATPTELPLTTEIRLPLAGARLIESDLVRVVFSGPPVASATIDGRRRFGWAGHEAGLLRLGDALPLFDELLGAVLAQPMPVPA
jgi:hypothetical protein